MDSSQINPADFCKPGTRRIHRFASTGSLVAGVGFDGVVHVWNLDSKEELGEFSRFTDGGSTSVAIAPNGKCLFTGTYHAGGITCVSIETGELLWRRKDLTRLYGLTYYDTDLLVCWFNARAGLVLDARDGKTRSRIIALNRFARSRFTNHSLRSTRSLELWNEGIKRHRWPRESFGTLAIAFSSNICAVSEAGDATRGFDLSTGELKWRYVPSVDSHIIRLDFSETLLRFVGVEYAFTDEARKSAPIVSLLHLTENGETAFRTPVRDWPDTVFCCNGTKLLNALGELMTTATGEVEYVFDFPK